MTWVAAAVGVAGIGAGLYSSNKAAKAASLKPDQYNMYGEVNTPSAGGIASRNAIFGRLNSDQFQGQVNGATGDYVNSLRSAANDPGLAASYQYALGGVRGDRLSDPTVDKYAQQAYQAQISQGADSAARTRASMARGGVGFSTGNQQAQDASMASAAGKGALARSSILTANRQFERGMQQQDVGLLNAQIGQRSSYLSQIPNAMYAPLQAQSNITTGLVGGNQIQAPTYMQQPNAMQGIANGVSTANGLYSAYQNIAAQRKAAGPTSGADMSANGSYNDMANAMNAVG